MNLEIICEIDYKRTSYFIDKDKNVYTVSPDTRLPRSPEVSYTEYNDEKFYRKVNDEDKIDMILYLYNKNDDKKL